MSLGDRISRIWRKYRSETALFILPHKHSLIQSIVIVWTGCRDPERVDRRVSILLDKCSLRFDVFCVDVRA